MDELDCAAQIPDLNTVQTSNNFRDEVYYV